MRAQLSDVSLIDFPVKHSAEVVLSIYETPKSVPFPIMRVFVIHAREAVGRGQHAHKECAQLLVCVKGRVTVTIDDAHSKTDVHLADSGVGLLIPPGLWASQTYEADSVLMVFASHVYDEADYIRSYDEYVKFKGL